MKKYLILSLVIVFISSILFVGIGCKEEVSSAEEVVEEVEEFSSAEEDPYEEGIRLTNNSSDDGRPFWSPDGNKIAFESYRDRNFEIYVINVDDQE